MLKKGANLTAIALAVCLAIGFGAAVWQASNAPHRQIHQGAAAQQQDRANSETKKESAENAIARYNWWLSLFTAVLAIATIALGLATVGLYLSAEKQLKHAKSEASRAQLQRMTDRMDLGKQIALAGKSANAAQRQVDALMKALKRISLLPR